MNIFVKLLGVAVDWGYFRNSLCTGWSISILYTLSGSYDNNNKCMKKIIVDIHSAYMEISSKIANLDIYKHLQSKI